MKELTIKRNFLIGGVALWWLVFIALSLAHFNNFQVLNIVGFLFLTFVPGVLTLLILRLKQLPFWANVSISVAFSLLELMVMVLIGNFFLPKLGIIQPLAQNVLIVEMSILVFALSFVAWKKLPDWEVSIGKIFYLLFPSKLDTWLSLISMLFVVQSIIGALSLNNGGTGLWTLAMLGEIAVFALVLYIYAKKIGENTVPTALFFISLSLLLMTSLRGWYITGHDIQQEYKVFELTKNAGLWNMDFYRDAYNACLSITILPTIFFNLLKVSDPYIYKFLFQLFFALCAGITYLISRHWADRRISFLAGFYFLSFPTFFADMAFLVRQEIAFLFYGLMIYLIFELKLDIKVRRILFVVMGIGVILSHYSTTYTILLIFALTIVLRPIFIWLFKFFNQKTNILKDSSLHIPLTTSGTEKKANITVSMIVILMLVSFLWTSVVTNTGGSITTVLKKTLSAIGNGFNENNRSTDALNLFSLKKPSQQEQLQDYIEKVLNPIRNTATPGVYFDASTYAKYNFLALPDERIPLTNFGNFVEKSGFNITSKISAFGRILVKLMEVLVPLGLLYFLLRRSAVRYLDSEFYIIAVSALTFIFLILVIPVLSTEYGIYRAMQQSMFVLALPILIASLWIGSWIKKLLSRFKSKKQVTSILTQKNDENIVFPVILTLLFFMYSTSFLPQIFGKTSGMLHLNNTGRYYDNYLIKAPEVLGVTWLDAIPHSDTHGVKIKIQTDRYSQRKITSLTPLDVTNEIFPAVVRKDAYVFLGEATTRKQRATVVYGGDQITYMYPMQFLDDNKNLIYNNGGAKIYK
ncbi:MAG: DUF2206 domain-containing protein [Patescibacteria group bacterium]